MKQRAKKGLKFAIRWGIAVAGIWYVLANINLSDRVMILDPQTSRPTWIQVLNEPRETDLQFLARDDADQEYILERDAIWTPPDRKWITLVNGDSARVLAVQPTNPEIIGGSARQILIEDNGAARIIDPNQVQGAYEIQVPYPLVDVGIARRIRQADPALLWLAILVFPTTYLLTGIRWYYLLRPLDIRLSMRRCLVLNVVGMFYSSFMLGTTGGDVVKAYYASKHATSRTRAIMSVMVDRIIGLLALILLGGSMATAQYLLADAKDEPIAQSSLKVALLCGVMLIGTLLTLVAFFHPVIRRRLGLDFLLRRLPMQNQVQKAIEVMAIYRQRKMLVLMALIGTLPVHVTVVVSAMFAGMAFDLPLPPTYYFVAVPVIVLVGSIPISPQGAGVMEFFAIRLTDRHGATIAQAFILTMSIRLVQMMWNLVGGLFVFFGGYQAPTQAQTEELQDATPASASA